MPIAYVEHQIPGRLRLRIPERRGDVTFFQRVVGALSKVPDVTELDGSPLTGSVRIRYRVQPRRSPPRRPKRVCSRSASATGRPSRRSRQRSQHPPVLPTVMPGCSIRSRRGCTDWRCFKSRRAKLPAQRRREFLERLRGAAPPGPQRDCGGVCASGTLSAAARTMAWLGILAFFLCAGGPPARRARSGRGCNDWPERVAALGKRAAEAPTKEANSRQAK